MRSTVAKLASLGLFVNAAACGAATPVRDMVTSGRWADVCQKIARGYEAGPGDIDAYDAEGMLAQRAPVKVGVRALSALDTGKRTGFLSGTTLRLRPFEGGLYGPMFEVARRPPGELFDREWLVMETTVEVDRSAIATVDLSEVTLLDRRPTGRTSTEPWAERWRFDTPWTAWSPVGDAPPEEQMLRTLGLLREGGTSKPTWWSMLDLTMLTLTLGMGDLKSRGTSPLLLSETVAGRSPTAEERAGVAALLALATTPRCTAIAPGASCTERVLLHNRGSSTVNAVRFRLGYTLGAGAAACTFTSQYQTPLPPGRTVREQLATVFREGSRPIGDIQERESSYLNSEHESSAGQASSTAPTDCTSTAGCALHGECHLEGGRCVARTPDCEGTAYCQSLGTCVARDDRCAPPAGAAEGCERACAWWGGCVKWDQHCGADTPAHCSSSIACKHMGSCQLHEGRCVALTSADCAGSEACREHGWCSAKERKCQAATDADCASAAACRSFGACKASEGLCLAPAAR